MDAIIRKYNYRLETGTVGTDDENIANVLYNINRLEMKKNFSSSDMDALSKALGQLFFLVGDAKGSLLDFLDVHGDKTQADISDKVIAAFDYAIKLLDDVDDETDTAKVSAVFPEVYKVLLDIVPSVLALDAQAVGRV